MGHYEGRGLREIVNYDLVGILVFHHLWNYATFSFLNASLLQM